MHERKRPQLHWHRQYWSTNFSFLLKSCASANSRRICLCKGIDVSWHEALIKDIDQKNQSSNVALLRWWRADICWCCCCAVNCKIMCRAWIVFLLHVTAAQRRESPPSQTSLPSLTSFPSNCHSLRAVSRRPTVSVKHLPSSCLPPSLLLPPSSGSNAWCINLEWRSNTFILYSWWVSQSVTAERINKVNSYVDEVMIENHFNAKHLFRLM